MPVALTRSIPDSTDCAICGKTVFHGKEFFELLSYTSKRSILTRKLFCSAACLAKYVADQFGLSALAKAH